MTYSAKLSAPKRRRKMQDVAEFRNWYMQGRTYKWMVEEYLRKYNLETSETMFSGWRTRLGLPPRAVQRSEELLPWFVKDDHLWLMPMRMLQFETRVRAGAPVAHGQLERLEEWKERLKRADRVVHYDPDTPEGFYYVPRREGIDTDLVRVPDEDLADED